MKRSIYGKKMFIADLILVSIWTFFYGLYSPAGILLVIIFRMALCFEMHRRSPWSLISAIGFLIMYCCFDYTDSPVERIFYIFFSAIGQSDLMVDVFSQPLEWEMKVWLGALSAFWVLWIAIIPLIASVQFHNISRIHWKNKWIWIYIVPLSLLSVWLMFYEGPVGGILLGLSFSFIPVIYWSIYNRRGRSAIQLLLRDRNVILYALFIALMLAITTIGFDGSSTLRFIGLLTFPTVFYILLSRAFRLGTVFTRCCFALSAAGCLFPLTFQTDRTPSIIIISVACALILFAAVVLMLKTKKWFVPFTLTIVVPLVIIPGTLGLNPYIILDSESIRPFAGYRGIYVVESTGTAKYDDIPYYNIMHGLRDRYGLILPMKFEDFRILGRGRYIATHHHIGHGTMLTDQRYGVFDLNTRKFVIDPDTIDITQIEKIDDRSFRLIDPEGNPFATLFLPGFYDEIYYREPRIEPRSE